MKRAHLYLTTKPQQHVHTESVTTAPPSRVLLESPNSTQMQCGDLPQCDDAALLFLFHLVHFESFHTEYLAALAFLQLLLHWVDIGELCLTEQPLALLQSKRLTAVFFHLRLSLTCFHVCRSLHVDQQHTNAHTYKLYIPR